MTVQVRRLCHANVPESETAAVHGCHSPVDMTLRMCEELTRPWLGVFCLSFNFLPHWFLSSSDDQPAHHRVIHTMGPPQKDLTALTAASENSCSLVDCFPKSFLWLKTKRKKQNRSRRNKKYLTTNVSHMNNSNGFCNFQNFH